MSDASEYSCKSVERIAKIGGIMDEAVHWGRKFIHQRMSALASVFRVMWWCMRSTVVDKSMRRRVNILPGLTTLPMWLSFPMIDFSCRFVHVLLSFHLCRLAVASESFSWGISIVIEMEFITIPRYTRDVAGPSILPSLRGSACLGMRVWWCQAASGLNQCLLIKRRKSRQSNWQLKKYGSGFQWSTALMRRTG